MFKAQRIVTPLQQGRSLSPNLSALSVDSPSRMENGSISLEKAQQLAAPFQQAHPPLPVQSTLAVHPIGQSSIIDEPQADSVAAQGRSVSQPLSINADKTQPLISTLDPLSTHRPLSVGPLPRELSPRPLSSLPLAWAQPGPPSEKIHTNGNGTALLPS